MKQDLQSTSIRFAWLLRVPVSTLGLWLCLWLNLNTESISVPNSYSFADWSLFIRGDLPFVVILAASSVLIHQRTLTLLSYSPSRLLLTYGVIAACATVFSPIPFPSFYFSVAFLATILTAWACVDSRRPLVSSRKLLHFTWMATFMVAAIIGYQARHSVFGDSASAYGVIVDLKGLSRSSGVARWAAVPGLVCLVRAYYSRSLALVVTYLGFSALAFFIVYRMQSRGAVFGAIAATLFALLVSSRLRRYALPFAFMAIIVILILDSPGSVSNGVATYLKRGQSTEEFFTMTGRTRAYEHGLAAFRDAPFFGRGQWADRLVIGEHVHDSFLQALLNGGIFGAVPYVASWVTGWILFAKLQMRRSRLNSEDRVHLLECGAVMMFFTVRSIPETTTASFSVDLLVMVAIYVYLETLTHQINVARPQHVLQAYHLVRTRPAIAEVPTVGAVGH